MQLKAQPRHRALARKRSVQAYTIRTASAAPRAPFIHLRVAAECRNLTAPDLTDSDEQASSPGKTRYY